MIKTQEGIYLLDHTDTTFPDPNEALADPNGLLAVGGDLKATRLLTAYQHGIFPWFEEDQPVLWWSPNPRCVLYPDKLKVSKSLKKSIHNKGFVVKRNTAFDKVIQQCRDSRLKTAGTWITNSMIDAYTLLHQQGHAHSYETWLDGELVGGLYGIQIHDLFCGESMFSTVTDSSKVALHALCQDKAIRLIDCQLENEHLLSLGAEVISRADFLKYLPLT